MSLRTRLLIAFAAVVFPIAVLALGLRYQMTASLTTEYQDRVERMVRAIRSDLVREGDGIQQRLRSVKGALANDNHFRAAIAGVESERPYLLDYGSVSMEVTGLSMLQILDGEGRIVTSGHFRNEHGRDDSAVVHALSDAQKRDDGLALVVARGAEYEFLALARSESLLVGDRPFTLIGGIATDQTFLRSLAHDPEIRVSLQQPGSPQTGVVSSHADTRLDSGSTGVVSELLLPLIRSDSNGSVEVAEARLLVDQPLTKLEQLLRDADSWFVATTMAAGITALLLAIWVSSRISRPLTELTEKTSVLDLDRLDFQYEAGTGEVGTLARVLGDLSDRLRASTARVREAERRATVGDLARQVNHDIKNGLIPLRNVMRHLTQVGREHPGEVAAVLTERRQTIDSSIAYLETLATNYERLTLPQERRNCDVHVLIEEVVRGTQGHDQVELQVRLDADPSRVVGSPIAFRRIFENLVANAIDSLQSKAGRVTVSTDSVATPDAPPALRITVADTGCGMSKDDLGRIFTPFYTTKERGTGLGLSIVRRLVTDLHGTLRVDSEPGVGTRVTIDLPPAAVGSRVRPDVQVPVDDRKETR